MSPELHLPRKLQTPLAHVLANGNAQFPGDILAASAVAHAIRVAWRCAALASRLRRRFSPSLQRWQNWHEMPLTHPALRANAHGLHLPTACTAEPTVGH
eukprot:CAMPEP_0171108898 /NCGR_PEP_ID=MMETSP0766_2-20121228/69823_1 /TAXON_ID=439317 /ORGANISM="Gambierdiscus australes, Strain CAWD 149" /LENGTH=98 /DNA_ID=CAMNT_0011570515 /DNA_START=53 /DNA_END=350 /DNA_ORIENTATION=+